MGDKCTLNCSCPDCYCERNNLASRDYAAALFSPRMIIILLDSELVLYIIIIIAYERFSFWALD